MNEGARPVTIAGLLAQARALGVDRLDAQLLIAHALGRDRVWVMAHDETVPLPSVTDAFLTMLRCRAAGEPLAYLTGAREFFGLTLAVTPDVLVPRPDTETLVEWALATLEGPLVRLAAPRVIDLGTGSGAVALAIKHACRRADVHASDISTAALEVARGNAERLGLSVRWHHGPWWGAVRRLQFDLAVSNPPYVAAGDAHLSDLRHEPAIALSPQDDKGDGLADIQRIAAGAASHLAPGAWLLIEHGAGQSAAVRKCLLEQGFSAPSTRHDLAGRERVTGAAYAR